MITPETLAELRRLHDKCQPGRVIVNDLRREHHAIWLDSRHDDGQWTTLRTLAEIDTETETVEVMWGLDDAVLMAGALNALPELLDAAAERDVLADRLAHMTEARDNARAEAERLTAQVERVRALHETWRIHSDGDHPEGCDCGEPTYIVCRSCCCDAYGDQAEECASYHDHDTDDPGCPTIRTLDGRAQP